MPNRVVCTLDCKKIAKTVGASSALGASYNSALMQALHYTRAQQLPDILAQRIVILDGAMGTMIQRFKLGEAQYRGEGYTGPDGAGDRFKDFRGCG